MNRIKQAFSKKAFIAFLTAGDPDLQATHDYILELEKAGASLIEIGIPFSDPMAEGPTIQEANVRALKNKVTTDDVFDMVEKVREQTDIPLCFMTYLNVVFHYGYDRFFQKCKDVGVDGIILPDLPYEESHEVKDICARYDVSLISMIAPTSLNRVEMIAKEATGFIYLVSSMGVTGTRSEFSSNLSTIIDHIQQVTDTPVAIGFGINTASQVQEFYQYADGVIVGSAIVNIIKEHGSHAHQPLREFVEGLLETS